jgi:DNA-binding GntR family transcriptional regulator
MENPQCPTSAKPIKRQTRYHRRRHAHLQGGGQRRHEPPPAARHPLGEADFCELYQVSRTTVRKALQRLAHDHIIELRPNRGAVIASPTPQARDIFAARRAIEREIVPLVIKHATAGIDQQIRAALAAEDAARRSGDRAGWIRLGGEFHLLLAELAGNHVLQRFMEELVSRCSLIIACTKRRAAPCARTMNTRTWPR